MWRVLLFLSGSGICFCALNLGAVCRNAPKAQENGNGDALPAEIGAVGEVMHT